jgi:hypothetical protein
MAGMHLKRAARAPKTVRLTDPAIDASIPVGLNGVLRSTKEYVSSRPFLRDYRPHAAPEGLPAGGGCCRFSGIAPSRDPTPQDG